VAEIEAATWAAAEAAFELRVTAPGT
jgi:hypothetical protein